ncbi:GyrI-like domain-containing protein [Bosea sp. BK604]|uniref:GyrI-like domain-containing protein n=1 Tax=Bosea sp. BK604 TaxID=2512180 RepID=UPI001048420A|nr:GyrI-like domain-containing protein [Bosea sp. BK604]TCR69811.1 GyrI-like small molecule binding protein [Bosea sp. BK604]
MRRSKLAVAALAILCGASAMALAQTRVAPPTAVEAAPLAPPPGATPAQVQSAPAQAQPTPVQPAPTAPPEPQPVQPPPAPPGPLVPQPAQPAPTAPPEPQPVQPPPSLPAPPAQAPATPPQQQTGAPNPNATLAGKPGDPSDVDEVTLVAKPALTMSGQSSWDQGFQRLSETFKTLRDEAAKAGLRVSGRPLTLFTETDDNGFRFDAMLPVERAPDAAAALGNGVKAGTTPAGQALRFVHTAPYDDIDSTYETITAYLEAKSIVVKDAFLEEYVSELNDPLDPNLEINVYVQPK